jgi:uncharacterized protein YdeI (YjbR/CyaY-like superfamily)
LKPRYFATAAELRSWFQQHHDTADELWVGVHKKRSGRPSITWPEAVDEALCFGWIDGIRRSVDDDSYANRFTPRKPSSHWSAKNTRRFQELEEEGRVRPAGRRAFEQRREDGAAVYSYEQRYEVKLDPAFERRFRANKGAWAWFDGQPDGYKAMARYWVMSAKRPEARERRIGTLIEDSAKGRRSGPLRRPDRGQR